MTVADIDIWRSANELVTRHGATAAWIAAVARVRELDQAGDAAGAAVWSRIVDAVQELGRTRPGPGETVQ